MVVVGVGVSILAAMMGSLAQSAAESEAMTVAQSLASGRMEAIQGLSFSGVSSVARANMGGAYAQYDVEIASAYVNGPSDLDTEVGSATKYKKVTVTLYCNALPGASVALSCIKVDRST